MNEENERKRHFLQTFRRWEALFKRADRATIKECLEITNPKRFDYANPFYALRHLGGDAKMLAATEKPNARLMGQIQAERLLSSGDE